jgi:hypothetical protein
MKQLVLLVSLALGAYSSTVQERLLAHANLVGELGVVLQRSSEFAQDGLVYMATDGEALVTPAVYESFVGLLSDVETNMQSFKEMGSKFLRRRAYDMITAPTEIVGQVLALETSSLGMKGLLERVVREIPSGSPQLDEYKKTAVFLMSQWRSVCV